MEKQIYVKMDVKATFEAINLLIKQKQDKNIRPLNVSFRELQYTTKKDKNILRNELNELYKQNLIEVKNGVNDILIYLKSL